MRVDAVITVGMREEIDDLDKTLQRGVVADPPTVDSYDGGEDAESRSADGAGLRAKSILAEIGLSVRFVDIIPVIFRPYGVVPLPCKTAHGVGKIPEIPKGLPLNDVQEGGIAEALDNAYRWDRHLLSSLGFEPRALKAQICQTVPDLGTAHEKPP